MKFAIISRCHAEMCKTIVDVKFKFFPIIASTAPSGPMFTRQGFAITHRLTTLGRTVLDE
jgi:hypothetical protein